MWEKLEVLDWAKYKLHGENSPDILALLKNLAHNDWLVRINAAVGLEEAIEYAYEKELDELPSILVPILIEFLTFDEIKEKARCIVPK